MEVVWNASILVTRGIHFDGGTLSSMLFAQRIKEELHLNDSRGYIGPYRYRLSLLRYGLSLKALRGRCGVASIKLTIYQASEIKQATEKHNGKK